MDKSRFSDKSPGTLVRSSGPHGGWAFVPDSLPPKWEFEPRLWPLLCEAKEALGTLDGIGQTLPNAQILIAPLQSREALTSSSLEGTHVTPEQLLLFELEPREPSSASDKAAEWREVFNYTAALRRGRELLESLPLCNRVIREMHKILMGGVRGESKTPGKFRKGQVQLGASGRFVPPPPEHVERLMRELEGYINSAEPPHDPLVRSFVAHYQFETIHPFVDGNGRVGRLLLALMIQKVLGHQAPWLYLSAFFERHKEDYIRNLFKVSSEGAWSGWIEFCLRATTEQARDSIRRCRELSRLRADFLARLSPKSSSRLHRIVEGLFDSPIVTIPALVRRHGIAYHTAQSDVARLANLRILSKLGDSRPKVYVAPAIFAVAYEDAR